MGRKPCPADPLKKRGFTKEFEESPKNLFL
jgi:hypothetical protein